MSEWLDGLSALHLLRPLWCLLLPLVVVLWWWRRRIPSADIGGDHFAPHLASALRADGYDRRRLRPLDTLALLAILLILGVAGPAWTRMPNPLIAQSAPLVVVLEVSASMDQSDVPPSRLERAKHKIQTLLERRDGARTALIAYAGSAHQVVPLTDDPALVTPYLEGLSSDVMPEDGDAAGQALALAASVLDGARRDNAGLPGAVLLVSDGVTAQGSVTAGLGEDDTLLVLDMNAPGSSGTSTALVAGATRVGLSVDDADVDEITRRLAATYQQALRDDDRLAWEDRGVWLAWPAALLALLGFRRGWQLGLSGLALLPVLWAGPVTPALAQEASRATETLDTSLAGRLTQGLADAFLTPDQQGRWWAERNDYWRAARHFEDPAWLGYALYRDGQYQAAVEVLERLDSADAAFTQGLALIKNRQYRPAIDAFETVLERDPDYPEGQRNLELAREILAYVEDTREQSDTGEELGIGADDVVFDNEEARGEDTEQPVEKPGQQITAEQWIETLDTDTSDFLRQRFAIEAQAPASSDSDSDSDNDRETAP
ncbi:MULTISPECIES: VWA domain-containing protein [unclassified Halomonas]|uniref:VWA domain-containing protein n=1 Tax=unclassified Halomonas TaxID=2609666 RepID=UPI0005F9B9C6|nr:MULTISPECIES: VWA domain-containing protein [unclassified Halomonas]MCO7217692.1 VWA domain-containing protein [Halomonas sp. OfavH-34-E]